MTKRKIKETTKIKLPINMQSKYMKKCPICKGPFVKKCINCGYINDRQEYLVEFEKGSAK